MYNPRLFPHFWSRLIENSILQNQTKKNKPQTNIIKAGYLPVHQQRNAVLPARIGRKYQPLDENLYILAAIFKYRNSI